MGAALLVVSIFRSSPRPLAWKGTPALLFSCWAVSVAARGRVHVSGPHRECPPLLGAVPPTPAAPGGARESSRRHAACNSEQRAHTRGSTRGQRHRGAVLAWGAVHLNQGSRQLLGLFGFSGTGHVCMLLTR